MPGDKQALGRLGEKAAADFLTSRGFSVMHTNFRTRFAEIDIIAKDRDTLCFIEVKTRRSAKTGLPREAVTKAKQKKIILGASVYLDKHKLDDCPVRFDVVEVFKTGHSLRVNLIKHAFRAG